VPATKGGAWWFHQIGEEIRHVIAQAGLTPSGADLTQLFQAIQQLILNGGGSKAPVRAATTANIATLAGGAPSTLDGVTLAANDRILVKDQSTGSQNGIYIVTTLGSGANGTWTRATDADGVGEIFAGMMVVVTEGTVNADTEWELTTNGAITIGTTALAFVRFVSTADFVASLATSGYQKLPGGLIIQWATCSATSGGTAVNFPIAFPTATYNIALTSRAGGDSRGWTNAADGSLTGFTAFCASGSQAFNYIAIGK
jgi:hypothetical protein